MKDPKHKLSAEPPPASTIKPYALALIVAWTLVTGGSLTWAYLHQQAQAHDMARLEALALFEKDVIYRRWSAGLGGVYAPQTKSTPPNPYLQHVKEHDPEDDPEDDPDDGPSRFDTLKQPISA